jgi:hypothetical protein
VADRNTIATPTTPATRIGRHTAIWWIPIGTVLAAGTAQTVAHQ